MQNVFEKPLLAVSKPNSESNLFFLLSRVVDIHEKLKRLAICGHAVLFVERRVCGLFKLEF
jgi:hypothetical protein